MNGRGHGPWQRRPSRRSLRPTGNSSWPNRWFLTFDDAGPGEAVAADRSADEGVGPYGEASAWCEKYFRLAIPKRDAQQGVRCGFRPRLFVAREHAGEVLPVAGLDNTTGTCSGQVSACCTAMHRDIKRDQRAERVDRHRSRPFGSLTGSWACSDVSADSFEQVTQALHELPGAGIGRELASEPTDVPVT